MLSIDYISIVDRPGEYQPGINEAVFQLIIEPSPEQITIDQLLIAATRLDATVIDEFFIPLHID